jgi:hypothetical protein
MIITNRHCLLPFIRTKKARRKKHKDDNFVLSFLCLRGVRVGGHKDIDNHRSLSFFIFHRSDKGQKEKTQR